MPQPLLHLARAPATFTSSPWSSHWCPAAPATAHTSQAPYAGTCWRRLEHTGHGLFSYGLCSYGLHSYGLHSYGLCSSGPLKDGGGLPSDLVAEVVAHLRQLARAERVFFLFFFSRAEASRRSEGTA